MIFTILFFIYLAFTFIFLCPFGIIAFIFSLLGARKLMANIVYQIAHGWAWILLKFTGSTITITGKENIPKDGGVCFVSNHEGYFDIVLLFASCCRPIGFVAKKELMLIPFLNIWIYMIGGLSIDRSNVRKALRTINKGVEKIKAGGGIIIFPEGHRSKGRGLLPFHAGSLKLATMAEAPIVPVALEGSYSVFEKTRRVTGTALKVTFCEPIETKDLPQKDRKLVLSDRIYSVIKEKLEQNTTA
jgi:1-acyl-sn-glycerol-3-phosphate acyltransferase